MSCSVRLEHHRLDPDHELREFAGSAEGAGALVTFIGLVRPQGLDDPVQALVLEHHPTLTEMSLTVIAREAAERFDVDTIAVVHRCGSLQVGEPIVFAAASSAHRRSAFEAVNYLMDRLKTDAVFWKREESGSGVRWIEPSGADYAARGRWDG